MKRTLAAMALVSLVAGCGGDNVFIVRFTSGTIDGDPICRGDSGQFDLRDRGGLLLLVVINSDTVIFLGSGSRGTCRDLAADTAVQVRGARSNDRITAQSITIE